MRAKPSYAEHAKGRKEPTSSRANPTTLIAGGDGGGDGGGGEGGGGDGGDGEGGGSGRDDGRDNGDGCCGRACR